jgi:hypothetical protein
MYVGDLQMGIWRISFSRMLVNRAESGIQKSLFISEDDSIQRISRFTDIISQGQEQKSKDIVPKIFRS